MQEACYCGRTGDIRDRVPVLNGSGHRALQCPECGHVDDLLWLSEEAWLLLWEKTIRRHESSSEEQRVA